jgi:hypothetical protein
MKYLICLLVLIAIFHFRCQAQAVCNKYSFDFYSGIILDDGFTYRKSIPVIGLGFSYRLNNFINAEANLISIYKTEFDLSTPKNLEPFNILLRESNNLFISKEDQDKIRNVGIKDLSSVKNVKFLYLPLSIYLNTNPVKFGRSSIGFGIGISAIYGTYKATRDFSPVNITLNDGTVLKDLPFAQEIEFRNTIIGDSYSKLYYKFEFTKFAILLSLHSYNFFWSHSNTETNHLVTLNYKSYF